MARKHTRIIGAAAALLAAGLAGFSLRSQQQQHTTLAARNPAADVRTQVIHRTIHIVRHQHPKHASVPHGIAAAGGAGGSSGAASSVRTGSRGSHAGAVAAGGSTAVTTRTSAHGGGSTSGSGSVTTRSSGGHGGDGGGDSGGD